MTMQEFSFRLFVIDDEEFYLHVKGEGLQLLDSRQAWHAQMFLGLKNPTIGSVPERGKDALQKIRSDSKSVTRIGTGEVGLLAIMADYGEPITAPEVADLTGRPKGTASAYISVLLSHGYLTPTTNFKPRKYVVSPEGRQFLVRCGKAVEQPTVEHVPERSRELAEEEESESALGRSLYPSEIRALARLAEFNEPVTKRELSNMDNTPFGTVSSAVSVLAANGYITAVNPNDSPLKYLVTPKGHQVLVENEK